MIPVLVISLERSTDRRVRISEHLRQLAIPFEFVNGVDGRLHCADQKIFSRRCQRYMMPGEIGCMLAHQRAALAASHHPFACVLEDDVFLSEDCIPLLRADALAALPRFDVLRLEAAWRGRHLPVGSIGGISICAPFRCGLHSAGQIYSQAGALRLSKELLQCTDPVDVHLYYDRRRSLRVLDVDRRLAHQPHDSSMIVEGHSNAPGRNLPVTSKYSRVRRKLRRLIQFWMEWGLRGLVATQRCSRR